MKKRGKATKKSSGGFHAAWLVLVELVASGLVVTIGLKYNFFVAMVAVCVPLYVALKKVATYKASTKIVVESKKQDSASQYAQPYNRTTKPARPVFGRPATSLATN